MRHVVCILAVLSLIFSITPALSALPTGTYEISVLGWSGPSNLKFSANNAGKLNITSVDFNGNLRGKLTFPSGRPGLPIYGFWNEDSKEIFFVEAASTQALQVWRGYYWEVKGPGNTYDQYLAGTMTATAQMGGTAKKHDYGWWALRHIIG